MRKLRGRGRNKETQEREETQQGTQYYPRETLKTEEAGATDKPWTVQKDY